MRALDPRKARACLATHAVLDARDERAYAAGHLAGSGNIARADFVARRAELPPRDAPVLVIAEDAAHAAEAAEALEMLRYQDVSYLKAPLDRLAGGLSERGPADRLWRPAPLLDEALALLDSILPAERPGGGPGTRPGRAPRDLHALDVACGSGRDAVHLALHGFRVEARDHDEEALARARELAARNGVTIRTMRCDLERPGLRPPRRHFDLVTCFRFLHRPLFPWMEAALAPGGWLVYETFLVGQARFGRPRRAHFLLEPGELARAFPSLETLRYEERDPEGGPVMARLIARKPDRGRG